MNLKEIVLAYVDAFNRGDVDALCNMFTDDAQIWGVLGFGTVEQARPIWQDLIDCLQVHLQVDSIISDGHCVAVRYTETGRSVRPFRGLGPTGNTYQLLALEWFELEGDRIARRWGARDLAAQYRQLGFV